jgi:uncharacterized protein YaaR (DUF327 family)
MDRVDALSGSSEYFKKNGKKIAKKRGKKLKFLSILKSEEIITEETDFQPESLFTDSANDIEDVLDKVFETGEKLKKDQSIENIRNYKSTVKQFLEYILKKTLKIEEKTSGINVLKRKKFTLIKIIDRKLESLAVDVLSRQKKQLEILEKIEEINGLIVDLIT